MVDETDISDFQDAFSKQSIETNAINSYSSALLKTYLMSLYVQRSDPEAALSEAFRAIFQADAPQPQAAAGEGSIDYAIETRDHGRIGIELKKYFEYDQQRSAVATTTINPYLNTASSLQLKDQIFRYAGSGTFEYIILTNLKSWFFYNPAYCTTLRKTKPFCEIHLDDAFRRFRTGFLIDGIRRLQRDSSRIDLGDRFYADLTAWVTRLKKLPFVQNIDAVQKLEDIIFVLNKFIFVRTLEANLVVQDDMIGREWNRLLSDYPNRRRLFLQSYFKALDDFFHYYYDTELFDASRTEALFSHIVDSEDNWKNFIQVLASVLGIGVTDKGIRNYRFEQLDIDIFGGTYERFLAEEKKVRKARGIYYTPQYVTDYIVYQTTVPYFDQRIRRIVDTLDSPNPDRAVLMECVNQILDFKICDIACGSGSFLTQAFSYIWEKYQELGNNLNEKRTRLQTERPGQRALLEAEGATQQIIDEVIKATGLNDKRRLASLILIRHIFGIDFDKRATDVAKLNLWLEAIRLNPDEFKHATLPSAVSSILPDLELNLIVGDSILGFTIGDALTEVTSNFPNEIKKLGDIRNRYINDPTKEGLVKDALKVMTPLLTQLSTKFGHGVDTPAHFPLSFWPAFFEDNGEPRKLVGFHAIVGNPPYGKEQTDAARRIMKYTSSFDTYTIFMERALDLLRKDGRLSYIVPVSWQTQPDFLEFRTRVITEKSLENIVNLPFDTFKDAYVDCGIVTIGNWVPTQ